MIHKQLPGILAACALLAALSASPAFASSTCPPDTNNDNLVNVDDLLAVVMQWGTCSSTCTGDVAPPGGNGVVTVDDLTAVILGWGSCPGGTGPLATHVWCENFELLNYSRWTGTYHSPTSCEVNGFSTAQKRAGLHSHMSRVVCSAANSHRGYAGLRFQGDLVLPTYTTSTGGINAPNGVIVTMWSWLDSSYNFDTNRWVSLLTCTHDCSNNWNQVVTLNIDDSSMRLKPVHVSSLSYAPGAPSFPKRQWNRITVYLNYYTGSMHVWQNGAKVCSASFSRPVNTMCQWHFGLYASGPNSDITLYEDDYSIVKLSQPLTDFSTEPRPTVTSPCGILP